MYTGDGVVGKIPKQTELLVETMFSCREGELKSTAVVWLHDADAAWDE